MRLVLFLLGRQMQHSLRARCMVLENVPLDVKVLPAYERLHRSQLKTLEGVLDTKTVLARVLTDLIKVPPDKLLLLDELDILEGLGGQLDSLVEAVFTTV